MSYFNKRAIRRINLIRYIILEESPNKWILKKIGDIIGFTMSMNKINNDGQIKQYLQPLVLNNQLSLRMCCIFTSPTPLIPYSIQIDMFSMKIKMTIMESHMLMITELLHSMKKSVNKNRNSDVSDDQLNNTHVSPTSSKIKMQLYNAHKTHS